MKIANHHKPVLAYAKPIDGYYMTFDKVKKPSPDKNYVLKVKNKGYRNFAYWLLAVITNTDQTIIDTGGSSRTLTSADGCRRINVSAGALANIPFPFLLNIGSSTSPHDVSRYELYSRHFAIGKGGIGWLDELTSETRFQTYHKYCFHVPDKAVGEAGLYLTFPSNIAISNFLIARVIISPTVSKPALTDLTEGWRIVFPANYTRWFLRVFYQYSIYGSSDLGVYVKATDGSIYAIREHRPFAGSPQLWIGSDNSPPSPTDYYLKSPISRLSSESYTVEIDTVNQECRVVGTGTYTPSTNVTLGEIAMLTTVADIGGTNRLIMVARGVWDTPIVLSAGTTYTIGLVLKLG